MKGNQTPERQESDTIRPHDQIQLFDNHRFNHTNEIKSDGVECAAFKKFGLYLTLKSTSTPTTIRFKVEFLDRWGGQWCTLKQGVFAALFYEDGDTATLTSEMFTGDVAGREMRVTVQTVGGTSTKYWDVSVSVDFWN